MGGDAAGPASFLKQGVGQSDCWPFFKSGADPPLTSKTETQS